MQDPIQRPLASLSAGLRWPPKWLGCPASPLWTRLGEVGERQAAAAAALEPCGGSGGAYRRVPSTLKHKLDEANGRCQWVPVEADSLVTLTGPQGLRLCGRGAAA